MNILKARILVASTFGAGLALGLSLAGQAKTISYLVDDPKGRDTVSFTSDAPIELIVGHTNAIKGKVDLDDSLDLSKKPLQGEFEVDLTKVDTGIALRNEHMRSEKFLNTAKFPKAIFKVTSMSATPTLLKDGETVKVQASGEFSLHGKTIAREIPVEVTYHKLCKSQGKFENCDLLQIKSTFPVGLKDYNIQRPEVVFQKLAVTVFVTVAATAHKETGSGAPPKKTAAAPVEKH
jgi:polyisoprenoid-binding protein YceI